MISDCAGERRPRAIGRNWKQALAKMPGQQTPDHIEQADEDQHPGSLKVEIPAPAVLVRHHVPVARLHQRPRRWDRQLEQRVSQHIAGFAPIEARVRDHNFQAGDQQGKKAQDGDPVSDADEGRVPRSNCRGWHSRGGTCDISRTAHAGIVSFCEQVANAGGRRGILKPRQPIRLQQFATHFAAAMECTEARAQQASRYAHATKISSSRKASNCFSGPLDSRRVRMTPAIVPCSIEATSCGSVESGSEEVANIRTSALLCRITICCTIFAPSTSELTEYR